METGDSQVSGGPRAGRGVFIMLVNRQEMFRWADDPVRQQGRRQCMGRHGRSGLPPQTDIGRQEEGLGRVQK